MANYGAHRSAYTATGGDVSPSSFAVSRRLRPRNENISYHELTREELEESFLHEQEAFLDYEEPTHPSSFHVHSVSDDQHYRRPYHDPSVPAARPPHPTFPSDVLAHYRSVTGRSGRAASRRPAELIHDNDFEPPARASGENNVLTLAQWREKKRKELEELAYVRSVHNEYNFPTRSRRTTNFYAPDDPDARERVSLASIK